MENPLQALMQSGPFSYRQKEPDLTYRHMADYMRKNPEMRDQFTAGIFAPSVPQDNNLRASQIMGESAAAVDPFAFSALQRLLGIGVPDKVWLNESHGLARREQGRYR